MKNDNQHNERVRNIARLEAGIWDALIGAHGSPAIQKFVIQQRLYAYARSLANIENDDLEREMRLTHSAAKRGPGAKIRQFVDFIEGVMSLEEAKAIKNALQDIQDAPNIQLASG